MPAQIVDTHPEEGDTFWRRLLVHDPAGQSYTFAQRGDAEGCYR